MEEGRGKCQKLGEGREVHELPSLSKPPRGRGGGEGGEEEEEEGGEEEEIRCDLSGLPFCLIKPDSEANTLHLP